MKLPAWFIDYQIGEIVGDLTTWDAPDFPNDVKALDFIMSTADRLRQSSESPTRIGVKYDATSQIFTQLLGQDCVEWARSIAPVMREAGDAESQ